MSSLKGFTIMAIFVDITGFYYGKKISAEGVLTVQDAMRVAAESPSPEGGLLTVSSDLNGFVSKITVVYPPDGTPKSRQDGGSRPVGTYSYDDSPLNGGNVVPGSGNIEGQLAWQYYVRRGGITLNADREIIPFNRSDEGVIGSLQDGDVVIWRLVAIFGLRKMMQENIETLESLVVDGAVPSMKSALRALKS